MVASPPPPVEEESATHVEEEQVVVKPAAQHVEEEEPKIEATSQHVEEEEQPSIEDDYEQIEKDEEIDFVTPAPTTHETLSNVRDVLTTYNLMIIML